MLTTKKKISIIVLSFFCLLLLFAGIFLLVVKPFDGNPVKYTFRFNEQEVFAKDNSLIARGILRGVDRGDNMVTLKVEMWNYTNNKYTVENISFPTRYLLNAQRVYAYEFNNSFPVVDVKFNFNRFANSDSKKIKDWFYGDAVVFVNIESVEVVDRVEELEKKVAVKNDYMSENIKNVLLELYNTERFDNTVHDTSNLLEYLKAVPGEKKFLREETFPFLRKALGLEAKYVLPKNYWGNTISETTWDWKKYTSLDRYLDTRLLNIDESRELWSDGEKHYSATERLGYVRRLSEFLWFASNYYLENSFDCNKQENMSVCKELVDLYTYNKATLADNSIRGGYGVCSATYMLPELVRLTKDDGLSKDLDLIIKNREKLYSSCTFSGGGNGLCARDLKESVNCGLLLANSGDMEMTRKFALDRYVFFDEIDYGEERYRALSSKNAIPQEYGGTPDSSGIYLITHKDSVKFLKMLDLFN